MYESMYAQLGRWAKAAAKAEAHKLDDYQEAVTAAKAIRMETLYNANSFLVNMSSRAVLETAGTPASAMVHVPEPQSVIMDSAQFFNPGLVNEFTIPRFDQLTPEFLPMTDAPASSQLPGVDTITTSPKRLFTYIDIAKHMLTMSDEAAGRLIFSQMEIRCGETIDQTVFGVQEGTDYRPQGMGYAITSGTDTAEAAVSLVPGIDPFKSLCQSLVTAGTWRSPVWITSPSAAILLQSTPMIAPKDDTTNYYGWAASARPIMDNGRILNLPVVISEFVSNLAGSSGDGALVMLASLKNIAVVQFGAWQVLADPVTMARSNTVRFIIQGFFDVKGLKGSSPTDSAPEPATQDNDYANVVVCTAIK